jgi:hypothetical protein
VSKGKRDGREGQLTEGLLERVFALKFHRLEPVYTARTFAQAQTFAQLERRPIPLQAAFEEALAPVTPAAMCPSGRRGT